MTISVLGLAFPCLIATGLPGKTGYLIVTAFVTVTTVLYSAKFKLYRSIIFQTSQWLEGYCSVVNLSSSLDAYLLQYHNYVINWCDNHLSDAVPFRDLMDAGNCENVKKIKDGYLYIRPLVSRFFSNTSLT